MRRKFNEWLSGIMDDKPKPPPPVDIKPPKPEPIKKPQPEQNNMDRFEKGALPRNFHQRVVELEL